MARMLNKNTKKGLCECIDCGNGPSAYGKAAEKAEWLTEAREGVLEREETTLERN